MIKRLTSWLHVSLAAAALGMGGLTYCPALLPPLPGDFASLDPPMPELAAPPASASLVAPPPPASARPDASKPAADEDPAVRILRTLEESAADLRTFTASIYYETEEALLGQKVIYKGTVIYDAEPGTTRKSVALLFDTTIEDRRVFERKKHYIIKDGWLVEIDHKERQFIKRQIVRPDQTFDPLKLGEGPIPLPIGQPVNEVLARFDVSLVPLPEDGPLRKLRGVYEVDGLSLVPKVGSDAAEEFRRIELFYDRRTHLPAGVNVIEINGDRKTARLGDLRRNPTLDPEMLKKLSIETPQGDWRVDVRPLDR